MTPEGKVKQQEPQESSDSSQYVEQLRLWCQKDGAIVDKLMEKGFYLTDDGIWHGYKETLGGDSCHISIESVSDQKIVINYSHPRRGEFVIEHEDGTESTRTYAVISGLDYLPHTWSLK